MGIIEKLFDTHADLDSVVILNDVNRYYFSGYDASFAVLFLTRERSYFITDSRYTAEANSLIGDKFEVVSANFSKAIDFIKDKISSSNVKNVGYEDQTILFNEYLELVKIKTAKSKEIDLVPISSAISSIRAVKTEEEIGFIRQAAQISDKAFLALQKKMKVGMTERDVLAELEYQMRLLGASGSAFDTIVAFGEKTAFPHAHSGDVKLEKGELVLIDFGAKYNYYCSDITRVLCVGEPIEKIKELHSVVYTAQEYALSAMRSGLTGREVDSFAREYIKSCGYGKCFTHALGHGLGLEIHEGPAVSANNYDELKENMVVTCEPGVYVEGLGGVRIEDTVLVKDNGIELLNSVSKEIIIL